MHQTLHCRIQIICAMFVHHGIMFWVIRRT
jgi:hypothetical protein